MTDAPQTAKHTPGPWDAALERGCHGIIARTLPEGGANFVAFVGNDTSDNPDGLEDIRFANAHLIAAAPDMLAALKAALRSQEFEWRYHARIGRSPALNPGMNRLVSDIAATKAAIAKAEGRSTTQEGV